MAERLRRCPIMLLLIAWLVLGANAAWGQSEARQPQRSRFMGELKKIAFDEMSPPETVPDFTWDFSEKTMHSYLFEQVVYGHTSDLQAPDKQEEAAREQTASAKGTILVSSRGNGSADIVLRNAKLRVVEPPDRQESRESEEDKAKPAIREMELPPMILSGMKEDGSGVAAGNPQEAMIRLLFPLPGKQLEVGEIAEAPTRFPMNLGGTRLTATGKTRLMLVRYVKVDDIPCAQLAGEIDVSELEIPDGLHGEYSCKADGAGVFLFDVRNRRFVYARVALLLSYSIDAPAPAIAPAGDRQPNRDERITMSAVTDNLLTATLQKPPEKAQPDAAPPPEEPATP